MTQHAITIPTTPAAPTALPDEWPGINKENLTQSCLISKPSNNFFDLLRYTEVQLQEYLKDKHLVTSNVLLLNLDETEALVLGPTCLRKMVSNKMLSLDGIIL